MGFQKGNVYVIFNKSNKKVLFGETGGDGYFRLSQHRSDLRKGIERNKSLQEDFLKYGEDNFDFEVIIETSEHELYELILMEIFSRVGMAYNHRRNNQIKRVERGEKIISADLYEKVERFIHRWQLKLPYYKALLKELEDMKFGFESKSESIYQRDFKNVFLTSKYSVNTQRVAKALFRKTAEIEKSKDKDLYSFNQEELAEAFKLLKAKTIRSLQDKVSTVERYIDFAKENGKTKINYATLFDSKDKLENLLDKEAEENMRFDKDEIMEMAMSADNAQDGVILGLLFDGVSHKNEFEELTNLTEDNIDEENQQIILENRIVPMSTETAILVRRALEEDKYVSIKGETSRRYKIAEGANVLRGLRGKAKVKGQIISQRILRIAEIFDYPYLNATTISYSGQLHLAKELINDGKNIDDVVPIIIKRFNINDNLTSRFQLKIRIESFVNRKNNQYDISNEEMDLFGEEIPLSQEYFYSDSWQEKIKASQKDLQEGRYKKFNNVEELFSDLDSDEQDNKNS
ncbi:hypothetical protein QUF99_09575 [Bacillus sp. DX4.1]|uniref:phage lytic cycle repressor MrpR family protein n=1 Tax=Bacillus sp. DX4.1 TaxID=3055867 RepID=UPI0025A19859|nr:hypothetical protein [Bacillus sp. DX4.1]MDM5187559.1 hypothetical protein [Bacillus sp. DX4.1]